MIRSGMPVLDLSAVPLEARVAACEFDLPWIMARLGALEHQCARIAGILQAQGLAAEIAAMEAPWDDAERIAQLELKLVTLEGALQALEREVARLT